MNYKQDVGDPWRTPTVATNMAVQVTLSVKLYMVEMTPNITMPHPRRIRILISISLGTKSYALI